MFVICALIPLSACDTACFVGDSWILFYIHLHNSWTYSQNLASGYYSV